MKIALLGYGKMGKVIEKIAISRGHEIALKIDKDSEPYDITTRKTPIVVTTIIPTIARRKPTIPKYFLTIFFITYDVFLPPNSFFDL